MGMQLLEMAKQNLQELGRLNPREIAAISGIGHAKAALICAALELGRRRHASLPLDKKQVTSSADIAQFLQVRLQDLRHEVFAVLFLNRANRINHFEIVSEGGITGTVADPRIILKKALENQYNSLVSAGKEDDALALLIKNKDVLQKAKNQSAEKYVSNLVEKSIKLNEVIKTLKKQQVDLELNKNAVEAQINQLNSQLINAKKKEAEQIKAQILEKENELVMINDLLKNTNKRIIEKNTKLDILNNSIEALKKAMTNTDLAAYNKPDVEIAIKKSRAIENELISKGINDQIEILEKNNPELRGDDNVTNELENSLVEIQNGSIDVIFNIDLDVAIDLTEIIKTGLKVYGAYLLYKTKLGKEMISSFMGNKKLIDLLVCPVTKSSLQYDKEKQELVALASGLSYPIRDGIPVMLESEARQLNDEEKSHWKNKKTTSVA